MKNVYTSFISLFQAQIVHITYTKTRKTLEIIFKDIKRMSSTTR